MLNASYDALRASFEALNDTDEIDSKDIDFLKNLIESPVVKNLIKVQEKLETTVANQRNKSYRFENAKTIDDCNDEEDRIDDDEKIELKEIIGELKTVCKQMQRNQNARDLSRILNDPHFDALIDAHDSIIRKDFEEAKLSDESFEMDTINGFDDNQDNQPSAIRMVGIRKSKNEPLGITVKIENNSIVIARILAGGLIEKQGLLHVGDVILEVNGKEIRSPEQLQEEIRRSNESIIFKISPSPRDQIPSTSCFMRALFTYEPNHDKLLPCKEVGIAFKQGDILEVLNQEDPNWWQARRIDSATERAGLIPSQELEERRRAFVRPEFDYATKTSICGTKITKKKKKEMYLLQSNYEFDKAELSLYEEVCRTPPFERKTLILIGAQGVGRGTLKNRVTNYDPERFEIPIPHTSRPIRGDEIDGKNYFFISREQMEKDIVEGKYLEYGEYQGHLYGTKLETMRHVIRSGRMCVIDPNPQCLKLLKNAEFMPYVVFIAAPALDQLRYINEVNRNSNYGSRTYYTFDRAVGRSRRARTMQSLAEIYEDEDLQVTIEESARIQRAYEKYFDLTIINNNYDKTFEILREAVDSLSIEHQWVPINWIYNSD
ncbi:MAGUK p55 subfamily member 6-like protein [Sarcoptes scabiei]|uniref:MAGUK p55 subfamily member 6-like protein n=1 Tax=Sarcoptes scabiei TaxID=52283 RepID=A0A131ZV03_SARSC|nr:MAGUK p55 subfamily member 6-like protein [Sarcoptes scabiei]